MYFLRPPLTEAAHCYKNKPRAKLSHEAEKTIKKIYRNQERVFLLSLFSDKLICDSQT